MESHSVMWWVIWPLLAFGMMRVFRPRGTRRYRLRFGGPADRWERDGDADPSLRPEALLRELEAQRSQMDEMAARLSELENRADFAERLLAAPHSRPESPS